MNSTKSYIRFSRLDYAQIGHIGVCWVEPEYRNTGCSRALVETIESWFDKRSVEFIDINYLEDNHTAKKV